MSTSTIARVIALLILGILGAAAGATAQAPSPVVGLGGQLFSTGSEITITVGRSTAKLRSELRLFTPDGRFTAIADNTQIGRVVTIPARPLNEELVFGIYTGHTFKMGPGDRNPDGLPHAVVTQIGEREYDVGFEDLLHGGDRDYDDNTFRFSGGLVSNRAPVAEDQAVTVAEGGSLAITLRATDEDSGALTFTISDAPLHGSLSGAGSAVVYRPADGFSGLDTFGFTVSDGVSAPAQGRITITITPRGAPPLGDCPAGELTLLNVRHVGRRVRLFGLAERTLAAAPVNIFEGGLMVARTTIEPDGRFRASVPVPSRMSGRTLRYQARIGVLHSGNLRLQRRMVLSSAGLSRGRVVLRGRVVGASHRLRRLPVVDLFARERGCGKGYTRVGRTRLRRDGTFAVSARPLPGVAVAVYRARVRLRGLGMSFTLPQTISGS